MPHNEGGQRTGSSATGTDSSSRLPRSIVCRRRLKLTPWRRCSRGRFSHRPISTGGGRAGGPETGAARFMERTPGARPGGRQRWLKLIVERRHSDPLGDHRRRHPPPLHGRQAQQSDQHRRDDLHLIDPVPFDRGQELHGVELRHGGEVCAPASARERPGCSVPCGAGTSTRLPGATSIRVIVDPSNAISASGSSWSRDAIRSSGGAERVDHPEQRAGHRLGHRRLRTEPRLQLRHVPLATPAGTPLAAASPLPVHRHRPSTGGADPRRDLEEPDGVAQHQSHPVAGPHCASHCRILGHFRTSVASVTGSGWGAAACPQWDPGAPVA